MVKLSFPVFSQKLLQSLIFILKKEKENKWEKTGHKINEWVQEGEEQGYLSLELATFTSFCSETFLFLHFLKHLQGSHLVCTGRDSGMMLEEENEGNKFMKREIHAGK